jgi:hypothetical protein
MLISEVWYIRGQVEKKVNSIQDEAISTECKRIILMEAVNITER